MILEMFVIFYSSRVVNQQQEVSADLFTERTGLIISVSFIVLIFISF